MNLRNALREMSYELGVKGQYTHDDVITELRVKHPQLVAENSRKLEDMAMKRILSDVEARQPKAYDSRQGEFFPELAGLPGSCDAKALGLTERKGARILLQTLAIRSVRAIASYVPPVRRNSSPSDKIRQYLAELEPYIRSEDEAFGDVIKRRRGS